MVARTRADRSGARGEVAAVSEALRLPSEAIHGGLAFVRWTGSLCWAIVGIVLVTSVAVAALATVSEVVLPVVLAVVLGVLFAPLSRWLRQHGWPPALAALAVVVGLIALVAVTVLLVINTLGHQSAAWSGHVDVAVEEGGELTDAAGIEAEGLEDARRDIAALRPVLVGGVLTRLVSGFGAVVGLIAGSVLGSLVLYYLLKDGSQIRARVVSAFSARAGPDVDAFVTRSSATIRAYGAGRTVLSAAVAVLITGWSLLLGLPMLGAIALVNFLGGYIPYVGAVVGGFVVVILALSEQGVAAAAATLLVVLLANLALENFVEPRVMGNKLDVHPIGVLLVTTLGGILGGIVGLILAVPLTLVASDAIATARRRLDLGDGPAPDGDAPAPDPPVTQAG